MTYSSDAPANNATSDPDPPEQPSQLLYYVDRFPNFTSFLSRKKFIDVKIIVEGKKIKAHRSRLASVSPLLASIFAEDPCEKSTLILADCKYTAVNIMINFIYSGYTRIAKEELIDVLEVAKILGIAPPIDVEQTHTGVVRYKRNTNKRKSTEKQFGSLVNEKQQKLMETNVAIFEGPPSHDFCSKVLNDSDSFPQAPETPETVTIPDENTTDVECVPMPGVMDNPFEVIPETTSAIEPAKRISPRTRIKRTKTRNDILLEYQNQSPLSAIVISGDDSNDASRNIIESDPLVSNVDLLRSESAVEIDSDISSPILVADNMAAVMLADDCANDCSEITPVSANAVNPEFESLELSENLDEDSEVPCSVPLMVDDSAQEASATELHLHISTDAEEMDVDCPLNAEQERQAETAICNETEGMPEHIEEGQPVIGENERTGAIFEENPDEQDQATDTAVFSEDDIGVVQEELCDDQDNNLPATDEMQKEACNQTDDENNDAVEEAPLISDEVPVIVEAPMVSEEALDRPEEALVVSEGIEDASMGEDETLDGGTNG